MTTDGYRNESVSQQQPQQHRGGEPSRIEALLHSLIDRLEETESHYAAALNDLESRLNDLSARAGAAGPGDSQAAAEALDRVGSQAAALAAQVREAEQAQNSREAEEDREAEDTFRAIENRIGEFAARLQSDNAAPAPDTPQQPQQRPEPPPAAPPEGGGTDDAFEQRFADVAANFEQSLAAGHATAGLGDLSASVDELAQRFDSPAEGRDDTATLRSIEEQLNALCAQFAEARQHYGRVDTIEGHLVQLLERTQTADSRVEAAARQAAQETARHIEAGSSGVSDRLDAVHRELNALNERAQAMDGRTADTLESMNAALHSLSDQLAASNAAAARPPEHPPAPSGNEPARPRQAADPRPARKAATSGARRDQNFFALDDADRTGAAQAAGEDPFLASARRAAQAAGAQPESGGRKPSLLSRLRRKDTPPADPGAGSGTGSEGGDERKASRPLLVMAVLFLVVASTALIYARLTEGDDPATAPSGASAPPTESRQNGSAGPETGGGNADSAQMQDSSARGALRAPLAAEPANGSGERGNGAEAKNENAGAKAASAPGLRVDPGIPGIAVRIEQAEAGKTGGGADSSPPPVPWTPQKKRAQPEPASHNPGETGSQPETSSRNANMPPAALGPQSLRLAAARGNAQAQYETGVRYAGGSGVTRDDGKAAQWFARAAAQGLAPAQYRLAALHESGRGVKKDAAMARVWYKRAAEQGNVKAMHNLAVMLAGGEDREADYEAAAEWFTKAARRGLTDSQFNLGILYEAGLGVKKNPENAYRWFSLAARRGDEQAEKRKQRLRQKLRREQIRNADRSIRQWRPKPTEKAANEVQPPEGGWQEAAASSAAGKDALVTRAQKLLNALGYDAGVPDGRYGPQTGAAVRRFEERNNLDSAGKVTPELVSLLEARAS